MINNFKKLICFSFLAFSIMAPFSVSAETSSEKFNIDPIYNPENSQQYQVSASLKNSFNRLDFYVEDSVLSSKTWTEKNEMSNIFSNLSSEFESKIYPQLTSTFGTEKYSDEEGIARITVLFYPMKEGVRGYIRNIDAYDKTINPTSNQREIIYLNSNYINNSILKEILAHEFTHLIELNQKDIKNGVTDDVWLNEARAEYAVTLLRYNIGEEDGYLDKRVKDFLAKPTDPLVEWSGTNYDYGVVSMFAHYLVEQYGIEVLKDTLASKKTGIDSINEFLLSNNYKETFADIYTNWSVAVYVNDCSLGGKYCYINQKLKGIKVLPVNTFMPFFSDSSISMNQIIKNWSTNWQKFVGGSGNLKMVIKSPDDCNFKAAYIVKDQSDKSTINFITFKEGEKKEVVVYNKDNSSQIIFIFSVEGSELEKTMTNPFFVYNTTVSLTMEGASEPEVKLPFEVNKPLNQMTRDELLTVILKLIVYLLSQGKTVFNTIVPWLYGG